MMTPYEKLRSLPKADRHLKSGLTFEKLDVIATLCSDNVAARYLNETRAKLFQSINQLITTKRRLIHLFQSTFAQAHVWIGKYCLDKSFQFSFVTKLANTVN